MKKIYEIGISHPVIKEIKEQKKHNKNKNIFIVEDLFALSLRKKYTFKVKQLLYCKEKCYSEVTNEILKLYFDIADEVYSISSKTYESIVDKENATGILAVILLNELLFNDIKSDNYPFIVVNDGIELPGNLGTIYRSADATSVDLIINVDSRTKANNPKVDNASRGMCLIIPTINCTYEDAQKFLLDNNYNIYLGEPILGSNYKDLDYNDKTAIVVGSERFGINNKWYDNKHIKVYIPMYGEMKSLNVGVAASLLMYEARIKRNK